MLTQGGSDLGEFEVGFLGEGEVDQERGWVGREVMGEVTR